MSENKLTGAEIVIKALKDQGVDVIFGYPGGAVLPIYDALFKQNRHAPHPGAPRAGGGRMPPKAMPARPASPAWCWSPPAPARPTPSPASTDALMDSIPMVVPHRPGADRT